MIQMNFTKEEIKTSLLNNRYDEVMATYLLLDDKRANLSVRLFTFANRTDSSFTHYAMYC